jgi:hypothetical protein
MTNDTPPNEKALVADADLEAVDAAEAPVIAEALADRLESDLEAIETRAPERDG